MIAGFFGKFRWLSNFVPVSVEFDEVVYPSVEHAYQAAKTLDKSARLKFADTSLPAGVAKRLGKKLVVRPNWERAKPCVMLALVRQKFLQEPFKSWLLETGDEALLEENSWGDVYWGVCGGVGENRLGKILVQVRDELRRVA